MKAFPLRFLNWRLIALLLALVIGIGTGLLTEPTHSAFAKVAPSSGGGSPPTVGRMCVFFAPKGAGGLGHVGWGFLDPTGFWFFGSLENRSGNAVAPGGNTYNWNMSGTEQQMYNTFAYQLVDPGTPAGVYHQAGDYTQYTCRDANTYNSEKALTVAPAYTGKGYGLPVLGVFSSYHVNNVDCLTEAQDVLLAYDSSTFDVNGPTDPYVGTLQGNVPKDWFYSLSQFNFAAPADIPTYF